MTSSCILPFQATQLVRHRLGLTLYILFSVYLLYVTESQSISEANDSGDPNGDLNFSESSEDECVHWVAITKPESE